MVNVVKGALRLVLVLGLAGFAREARADEAQVRGVVESPSGGASEPGEERPDWSASIGGGLGAINLSGFHERAGVVLGFERRLGGPVWLSSRLGAGLHTMGGDELSSDTYAIGAGLGLRVAIVEQPTAGLSLYAMPTFARAASRSGRSELEGATLTAQSFGGELGASVDLSLLEGLGLRLQGAIARAGFSEQRFRHPGGVGSDAMPAFSSRTTTTWAALGFAPTLEARWVF